MSETLPAESVFVYGPSNVGGLRALGSISSEVNSSQLRISNDSTTGVSAMAESSMRASAPSMDHGVGQSIADAVKKFTV